MVPLNHNVGIGERLEVVHGRLRKLCGDGKLSVVSLPTAEGFAVLPLSKSFASRFEAAESSYQHPRRAQAGRFRTRSSAKCTYPYLFERSRDVMVFPLPLSSRSLSFVN